MTIKIITLMKIMRKIKLRFNNNDNNNNNNIF